MLTEMLTRATVFIVDTHIIEYIGQRIPACPIYMFLITPDIPVPGND